MDESWKSWEPGVSASTTDDVIVIYVEGDNSTTLADLQGTEIFQGG